MTVQAKCVVLKIKNLSNSSENNLYGMDKESHKTYTRIISGTIKTIFLCEIVVPRELDGGHSLVKIIIPSS